MYDYSVYQIDPSSVRLKFISFNSVSQSVDRQSIFGGPRTFFKLYRFQKINVKLISSCLYIYIYIYYSNAVPKITWVINRTYFK
jgi:hypothetical protein